MKIGDYLIVLAVALVVVILVVALFRGDKVLTTLEFCLVLLVAAIPEPGTWASIALGFGLLVSMQRFRKRRL